MATHTDIVNVIIKLLSIKHSAIDTGSLSNIDLLGSLQHPLQVMKGDLYPFVDTS